MITFVLYDDKEEFRKKTEKVIKDLITKNGGECIIESYGKYDESFKRTIENYQVPKIYILDIEVPESESGIDIAKIIRKKDWNSVIILVTSHVELGYEALKAKIMLLDFISKYNDWRNNLIKTVKEAVTRLGKNNILVFESNDITHRIYAADILYIVKDSIERKCIIKTNEHTYKVNKTMMELGEMLDERFYLSHRSCYINLEKIAGVNWKENIIHFEEGSKIDYLSRDKKKGLKEYVRST